MDVRSLLFGFLVLAMVTAGCSGDDDDAATPTTTASATTVAPSVTEAATTSTSMAVVEAPTTTAPPAEVVEGAFTFADDDLCEWVSAEKVAEFVAAEFDDPDVTAVLERSGAPRDPDSCEWYFLASTAPDEYGTVVVGNAESSMWGGGGWEDDLAANPNDTDFAEQAELEGVVMDIHGVVSGHPSLSDGVVVRVGSWSRMNAFWVPPIDEYLSFFVYFPEVDGGPRIRFPVEYQPYSFGVADRFVQELGWLG